MTDGALRQLASDIKVFATRDVSYLAPFNITAEVISAMNDLAVAFNALPFDAELRNDLKDATRAKNFKKKEITAILDYVQARARMVFGIGTYEYEKFEFEKVDTADDDAFPTIAHIIARTALDSLAALAVKGQTEAELTLIATKCNEFIALMSGVKNAFSNRRDAAIDRINAGNTLYDAIGDIASAAKTVFSDIHPEKYPDYLLYPDAHIPKTSPDAPEIDIVDGNVEVVFDEDVTSIHVEFRTSPNGAFTEAYDGEPQPIPVVGNPEYLEVKAFGRNAAGNGAVSTEIFYGTPSAPTNVRREDDTFMWDVDESVDEVEFDVSYDNGVTYNQVAVMPPTQKTYPWTPPSGTILARMRTKRNGVYSPYIVVPIVIP